MPKVRGSRASTISGIIPGAVVVVGVVVGVIVGVVAVVAVVAVGHRTYQGSFLVSWSSC